jgi:hypothetical protein
VWLAKRPAFFDFSHSEVEAHTPGAARDSSDAKWEPVGPPPMMSTRGIQ